MSNTRAPALFLGHGSPMTVITENPARAAFAALGGRIPKPRAVLCISAHWETRDGRSHLTAGEAPATIHDFRGFPPELFAMRYPAPGHRALVDDVAALLGEDRVVRDEERGFDHGAWGVLQPMFPQCDVPTVQLGIDRTIDAEGFVALGTQLAPLRDDGVMIVGSGNIIHNLALWHEWQGNEPPAITQFGQRIKRAVAEADHKALTHFGADDEAAAQAINSAEHYIPLLYVVGARLPGDKVGFFNDAIDGNLAMTSVLIGEVSLLDGIQ